MSVSTGRRLGPYEVVARVGAGGIGEVYRARDPRLERTAAIEVLSPQLAEGEAYRHRAEQAASRVRRPASKRWGAAWLWLGIAGVAWTAHASAAEDTLPLFDGRTLRGWRASENASSFKVVDGAIACDGPRSHLFYVGADARPPSRTSRRWPR